METDKMISYTTFYRDGNGRFCQREAGKVDDRTGQPIRYIMMAKLPKVLTTPP